MGRRCGRVLGGPRAPRVPHRAVAEIARVLKPNGIVLFGTPFLQAFHAYPNHFQNLTLIGHERMVQRVGLEVVQSGAIGQTSALVDLTSVYLRSFLPGRIVPGVFARCLRALSRALAPIDRALAKRADAHIVASNVWVLGRRPPGIDLATMAERSGEGVEPSKRRGATPCRF
jgi:SAM-dependent methyltransferase